MKKFLNGTALLAIALFALTFTSCKEDDPEVLPEFLTIADQVIANPNLTVLEKALIRAELVSVLDGTDKYTVFAPNDLAFNAFLAANNFANVDAVPKDVLTKILLNHVLKVEVRSTDITNGAYPLTEAKSTVDASQALSLFTGTTGGVFIGNAKVTTADFGATNGVFHVVDQVIAPPSVVNQALNNPAFDSLVVALTQPGLAVNYVELLSKADGKYTVFAPTNDAFKAILTDLGLTSIAKIPKATLDAVLQYHVVSGANVRAGALTEGQVVTTVQGGTFKISLVGGAKITDAQNRVTNIIITDVQADNGVVHAINKVLLP